MVAVGPTLSSATVHVLPAMVRLPAVLASSDRPDQVITVFLAKVPAGTKPVNVVLPFKAPTVWKVSAIADEALAVLEAPLMVNEPFRIKLASSPSQVYPADVEPEMLPGTVNVTEVAVAFSTHVRVDVVLIDDAAATTPVITSAETTDVPPTAYTLVGQSEPS